MVKQEGIEGKGWSKSDERESRRWLERRRDRNRALARKGRK